MRVCLFDIVDFVCLLLVVCVFELAVHVEVLFLALAVCVLLMCVCKVIVNVCQIFLRLCVCVRLLCSCVDDLLDPAPEAADSSVQRGRGGVGAAVTPGDDPGEDPPT